MARRSHSSFDVDVVVVGAGFTGLAAATALQDLGIGVVVLEANDRVGGKVEAQRDERGRWVDTGGQFVFDGMTEVLALAHAAGARRVNAVLPGDPVTIPADGAHAWGDGETLLATLGDDERDDSRTVLEWAVAEGASARVVDALRSMVDGSSCRDSRSLPVSYLAELAVRTPDTPHELQYWFEPSMHSLAAHLAAGLGNVRTGCTVRAVHVHDESVDVVSVDRVWHARHVIVAIPPSAYGSMLFTPDLPDDFVSAADAFRPGVVIKYLLGYDQPFWTATSNGIAQFVDPPGLYLADASTRDAPTLVGFVGGATAAEWARHPAAHRRAAILHHATIAFGEAAGAPTSVVERVWSPNEFGSGGYCNVLAAHAPSALSTLLAGLHLLTFASTELATQFPGYVEGALRAGSAAAQHVARAVDHDGTRI